MNIMSVKISLLSDLMEVLDLSASKYKRERIFLMKDHGDCEDFLSAN
jgi:hypothetical protein